MSIVVEINGVRYRATHDGKSLAFVTEKAYKVLRQCMTLCDVQQLHAVLKMMTQTCNGEEIALVGHTFIKYSSLPDPDRKQPNKAAVLSHAIYPYKPDNVEVFTSAEIKAFVAVGTLLKFGDYQVHPYEQERSEQLLPLVSTHIGAG